jgi:hypothetical protein
VVGIASQSRTREDAALAWVIGLFLIGMAFFACSILLAATGRPESNEEANERANARDEGPATRSSGAER